MVIYSIWLPISLVLFFSQVYCQKCEKDGCPYGLCCSEYGFCGNQPEYCEKSPLKSNLTLNLGDCRICGCPSRDDCCSHYGFCGNTKDHCAKLNIILPESTLLSQTRMGDCRICQNCQKKQICCPNTGYCIDEKEKCYDISSSTKNKHQCQPDPMKFYKIYHHQNEKFLDCQHFSTNFNSSTITQWPESNTFNQLWQFISVHSIENIYLIISIKTTKALTISTSSYFLEQWSYDKENLYQQFQLQLKNNLCKIINLQTNQSLIIKDKFTNAPLERTNDKLNLWQLIETNTIDNRHWNIFLNNKFDDEICDDKQQEKYLNQLTLNNCLKWCNLDQRTKYCMWNFNNQNDQIGFCISANQCSKRIKINNEKYRIYIHKSNKDILSTNSDDDDLSIDQTASLTNYIDYTKYLLLEANNFTLPSEPLHCTDLDPQKQALYVFEATNKTIPLCNICPNLPPFDKYINYLIDSNPIKNMSRIKFNQCFQLCVDDIQCIGYSYNEQSFLCSIFNQTSLIGINGLIRRQHWTSVLIKQPIGIIKNWLYSRHTKIAMQFDETNLRINHSKTFLECLNICSHSKISCLAITYDFQTKQCQLFERISTNNWIQSSYGSISAFHFLHIYKNDSNQWKFQIEDEEKVIQIQENLSSLKIKKTCTLSNQTSTEEYEIYYNPKCLISGGNGCDRQTGCQLCLKFKANFEKNLPLCPSSLAKSKQQEEENIIIENCMKKCLNQSISCIGFDYDIITSQCIYINTYSNWSINDKKDFNRRYLLSYPPKPYEFIPDCQLMSSLIIQTKTFTDCLNRSQSIYEKISYNYNTLECRLGDITTGIFRIKSEINSHCFIENFLPNNDLTSIRMAFYRYIGYQLNHKSFEEYSFHCNQSCTILLDQCLMNCLNSSKCQYISVTYKTNTSFSCSLFTNQINEINDFISNNLSEIYYRYFNINLNEETINKMPLFQVESDLNQCFEYTTDQTYSSLKGYKDVLNVNEFENNVIKRRQRRFLGFISDGLKKIGKGISDGVKWVGNNIVKPVVNTAVEVVKAPVKLGEAAGKAIMGDGDGAKKALTENAVLNDLVDGVNNAISLTKSVGSLVTNDLEGAKKHFTDTALYKEGKSIADSAVAGTKAIREGNLEDLGQAAVNLGLDVIGDLPIPGGRAAKAGSKGLKKSLNKRRRKSKSESQTRKKRDNKNSRDEKNKQCRMRRSKRSTKRDRCERDNDDDEKSGPKCRKPDIKHKLEIHDCHMKSVGTKCRWKCDAAYIASENNGVTCKKDDKKKAYWRPKPQCNAQSCESGDYPLISVETDNIVAYTVYFDKKLKLPIWSFAIHDIRNRVGKLLKSKRSGNFYQHPCSELKNHQGQKTHYLNSGWDRGHLSPSDAHRYSKKASKSSNLFINVAPQDPWTNQEPWKIIEAHMLCHNNKYPASLVATGVCPNSIGHTKAGIGLNVPSCFWKMICYVRNGKPHVVGFLADNHKVSRSDKNLRDKIRKTLFKPVSQATIRERLMSNSHYAKSPFNINVYQRSNKGRGPTLVQPLECASLMGLDQTEADAWYNDFLSIKKSGAKEKKSKKKSKRALFGGGEARGCTPEEARAMALFMGLNSLDIDDDDNGIRHNDDDNDDDDDDDLGDNDDDGGSDGRPAATTCGKRIIGYYPSWGKGKISGKHIRRLTHIIYAFFEVDSSGQVFLGSADRTHSQDIQKDIDVAKKRLEHLLKLKKTYSQQKYLFAVGGWENSQYFSSIAQSPDKRLRFIGSSLKLLDEYDLDGIDIDWEHPVTGGAIEGIPQDKQNYVLFMKEIRQALDQHGGGEKKYLLSFASAAGQWTLDPGYDLPSLLKYADFVNIMTYDFFGAWESKWGSYTGPPAPLYFGMPPRFSGKTNVDWTVKYYMCRTNQPHQINMGVPFYGRYWKNVPRESIDPSDGMWRNATAVNGKFQGGFASWNEIKTSWLTNPAYQQQNHAKSKSSYAYNENEGIFLGFESPQSLKDKVIYASDKNVGGLMIWAIDQDDDDLTMMNIVSNAPLCKNTNPKTVPYKCSPLKGEKRWWTLEDSEEKAGMCGRSAPLYKGYYPLCDPDDPGYSCCSPQGYCGFSDKHCKGEGVNYGENPDLLVEEPVRPTINPILWYLLDAPDGKRGRCGREVPKLDNGEYAICNPDDKNGHCCSNGGYCGSGAKFCDCEGCIDFQKQKNYRFKAKNWHDDGKCGEKAEKINNEIAICNPDSKTAYCCSASGYCGSGAEFCDCKGCINYKK